MGLPEDNQSGCSAEDSYYKELKILYNGTEKTVVLDSPTYYKICVEKDTEVLKEVLNNLSALADAEATASAATNDMATEAAVGDLADEAPHESAGLGADDQESDADTAADVSEIDADWTESSVKLLLSLILNNKEEFGRKNSRKKGLWKKIANLMANSGYNYQYSSGKCSQKWRNLLRAYRSWKDNQSKTGRGRKDCAYSEQISQIMGDRPSMEPLALFDTLGGSASVDPNVASVAEEPPLDPNPLDEPLSPPPQPPKKRRRSHSREEHMMGLLEKHHKEQMSLMKTMAEQQQKHHEERLDLLNKLIDKF